MGCLLPLSISVLRRATQVVDKKEAQRSDGYGSAVASRTGTPAASKKPSAVPIDVVSVNAVWPASVI